MDLAAAFTTPAIPIQSLADPLFSAGGGRLSILRADRVHAGMSGNKWFKLKHNLIRARREGHQTLLSFGGPWSNHLHALALAGREFGFRTVGIVRGQLPEILNPCLQDAVNAGMQLHAVTREQYRHKNDPVFLRGLENQYGEFFLIPEGGANREGALGCAELADCYAPDQFDLVCMACGTGTMLAGLASRSPVPLLGIQVLKGEGYLAREVQRHLDRFAFKARCHWQIDDRHHGGGYARTTPALMAFIEEFERLHRIPLEPVYTGKVLHAIMDLKKRDFFPQNWSILVIHSGGLQGRRGFI